MSTAIPSDAAERLGNVRASIRPNLEISRQTFGGKATYVIRDPVTAQSHSLPAEEYQLFVAIDQARPLKEVVQDLLDRGKLDSGDVENFYKFVVHLQQLGLLALPLADGATLHKRYEEWQAKQRAGGLMKLMSLKLPLFKPDGWLTRTQWLFWPLFTKTAFAIWLIALLVSISIVSLYWREFANPLATMLTLKNLPTLWCLLVGLKAFHELGHAYACKRFGGSVPEMGVILMMGTPCAYVDASSSWSFASRWQRIVVVLAGMYFESILAIVALAVWLYTDPGLVHSAAQYAVTLATIVTIGFNANPLMRYDGYYLLSDLLNYPNLQRDAKSAAMSQLKLWFWGVAPKACSKNKYHQAAMATFGLLCLLYGITITIAISAIFCQLLPGIGLALTISMCAIPWSRSLLKLFKYLLASPELEHRRRRAFLVTAAVVLVAVEYIAFIPIPGRLEAKGVVHRQTEQSLRSETDGILIQVVDRDIEELQRGDHIARLENHDLELDYQLLLAEVHELDVRLQSLDANELYEGEQLQGRLEEATNRLEFLRSQLAGLNVVALVEGQFVRNPQVMRIGRFVRSGELMGTLCQGAWIVRTKLTADMWTKVQARRDQLVKVVLSCDGSKVWNGRIVSGQVAGSNKIDEQALTFLAGGEIAVSEDGTAAESFFEVDVEIIDDDCEPEAVRVFYRGMTAQLSLARSPETLAQVAVNRAIRFLNHTREAAFQIGN